MGHIKDWLRISLILCTFGFLREMRPSEPFVIEFLSGEWRNITAEQVNKEVYPWGTYSNLAQLVLVFLITDILRYKPIIVMSAIAGIIMWTLLLWTYNMLGLQLVQMFYGFFMSSEVAYYTYIYAKVDRKMYQKVTGQTRAAILSGKFLAGVLAQLLVSYNLMNLRELNFVSLATQVMSLMVALMLPSAGRSLYFYSTPGEQNGVTGIERNAAPAVEMDVQTSAKNISTETLERKQEPHQIQVSFSARRAMALLWSHFVNAYSNQRVLQWSMWWSLAMCGFLQVANYVQLLWKQIDPDRENFYNGAVEATHTILGAGGAFVAGFLNSGHYQKWDLWIITLCSLVEGALVFAGALTRSMWVAYITYILFGTIYHFMITIASAIVAKNLPEDSFGLIFGFNTFLSLGLQSIFTIIVVSDSVFVLDPRQQFITFGGYFIVLSIIFAITELVQLFRRKMC